MKRSSDGEGLTEGAGVLIELAGGGFFFERRQERQFCEK